MMALNVILNYGVVSGMLGGYFAIVQTQSSDAELTVDAETMRLANRFCLAYYLSPLGWVPIFSMGIMVAFLFDAYRPYLYHTAYLWGILCDTITAGLIVQTSVCNE